MDEELIARWNSKVPKTGKVYLLGDISFRSKSQTVKILNRLHGDIACIKGNHDKGMIKGEVASRFAYIKDYHETRAPDGRKLILCHYPMATWNGSNKGSWMLHGHCHGSLNMPSTTRLDVGVDTHSNYEPYSWEEIYNILINRDYAKVDHHD